MITSTEKRVLFWLEKHIWLLAAAALTLMGAYARYCLREFISGDYKYYLESWYEQIKASGGDLSRQVGNYSIPYQIMIALIVHLPVRPFVAYKILSCVFDVLLAIVGGITAYCLSDRNIVYGILAYGLIFCSPIVVLNSAAWAQCDAIYTFFALSALAALLIGNKPLLCMLLFGASLAFKLQAIFLLPFLLLVYFVKKSFSLLYFAAIPAVMTLLSVPALLGGRPWSDVFAIYAQQTDTYKVLCANYPSFWAFFGTKDEWSKTVASFSEEVRPMTIMVCLAVLGLAFCLLSRTQAWHSPRGMLYAAFLSVYACVLLLPSMHERYGYLYEILALILALLYPKTGKLCVAMMTVTLYTYGCFLVTGNIIPSVSLIWPAAANMAIFLAYMTDFARRAQLLPAHGEEKLTF